MDAAIELGGIETHHGVGGQEQRPASFSLVFDARSMAHHDDHDAGATRGGRGAGGAGAARGSREPPRAKVNHSELARERRHAKALALQRGDDVARANTYASTRAGSGIRATLTSHERLLHGRPINTRLPRFMYAKGAHNEQGHGGDFAEGAEGAEGGDQDDGGAGARKREGHGPDHEVGSGGFTVSTHLIDLRELSTAIESARVRTTTTRS